MSWIGGDLGRIGRSCGSTVMKSGSTGSFQGQTTSKACPELGIPKTSHSAHHKKHIAKVMAHCCVGYLFEVEVEAGGDGFLISCDRCASFKMPLRNSYVSTRDAITGQLKFKVNALKHTKGVPYLVDCAVTGSYVGTATKPCFPLRKLWEYTLIPAIAQLVGTGGPCADDRGFETRQCRPTHRSELQRVDAT
jgi:hypothetical protein